METSPDWMEASITDATNVEQNTGLDSENRDGVVTAKVTYGNYPTITERYGHRCTRRYMRVIGSTSVTTHKE